MAQLWNRALGPIRAFYVVALCADFLVPRVRAQQTPDFTQAQAMLGYLQSCAAEQASPQEVEHVVALPGTDLVIKQQNISRTVTMQQYRSVLEAACGGKIAVVKAAEDGTRAERGVEGLTQDVGPSLVWGRQNLALLESRLEELRRNRSIGDAVPLANKYLPEPIPLAPKFYVVMGGRAGAAAIDDQLYFDVLSSSWRASIAKTPYTTPAEVVEFFAHEAHHLGYGQILERKQAIFHFTRAENQAWNLLTAIIMEGSATFLINSHGLEADLQQMPGFQTYLEKVPQLLPATQDVLRKALAGPMTDEQYDQASSAFLGMGYHATGAKLLNVIFAKRGLKGVMEVMSDPRQLLTAYNEAASSSEGFRFDPLIASRIAHLGEPRGRQAKTIIRRSSHL